MKPPIADSVPTDPTPGEWLEIVRKNVEQLRFGSVHVTVHDGCVTQVESVEKTRFRSQENPAQRRP